MIAWLCAAVVLAQDSVLVNGGFSAGLEGWVFSNASGLGKAEVVGSGSDRAVRLTIPDVKAGSNPWDVELKQTIGPGFRAGDTLDVRFMARSASGSRIRSGIQESRAPFSSYGSQDATLTASWSEVRYSAALTQAVDAGGLQIYVHANFLPGSVELKDFRVTRTAGSTFSRDAPGVLIRDGRSDQVSEATWGSPTNPRLTVSAVAGNGSEFMRATRFVFDPAENSNPWDVGVHRNGAVALRPGDTVLVKAWMRSRSGAQVGLMYERTDAPHTKYVSGNFTVGPEWREYQAAGRVTDAREAGDSRLAVFLGYGKGDVEIGGLEVLNLGATPISALGLRVDLYGGRANPDSWRSAAEERIETIRKGDLTVRVVDAQGRAVAADVKVEQVAHDFRFGTAAPAAMINDSGALGDKYRSVLKEFFNTVTFENDLKWQQSGMEPNAQLGPTNQALDWLRANGFRVKGHVMVWGSVQNLPNGVMDLSNEDAWAQVQKRIRFIGQETRGKVYSWDVVNEAVTEEELWEKIGWDKFVESYRVARQVVSPETKLVYNDFNWTEEASAGPGHKNRALALLKMLKDGGAPVDYVGLQAHVSTPATPIGRVLEIVDEIAAVGYPVEITEYDFGTYDSEGQAKHMEEFLTAMFSHPKVESFIVWGFWEGAHWRPDAAFFNRDWTEKPLAKTWRSLVKGKWWTVESGQTSGGSFTTRAFYGKHKVTVTVGGKSVTKDVELVPGGPTTVEIRTG